MALKIATYVVACFLMFLTYSISFAYEGYFSEQIKNDLGGLLLGRFGAHFFISSLLSFLGYLFVWIFTNADGLKMQYTYKQYYIQSQIVYLVFFILFTCWFIYTNI